METKEKSRKIIHIDMDSFFASVEIRDQPELATKPVIVGGMPEHRGVVATSNYVARKYGIHSAMPTARAVKLCPSLVIIYPNMNKYKKVSENIHNVFKQFTDKVEPLSLDEAYLDVTECKECLGSATLIAKEIRKIIYDQENLTASAGVAPNKFLAKVASDWNKPDGLFVITPGEISAFVENLSIKKIPGVGPVMASKLKQLGIFVCKDLYEYSYEELRKMYGKMGDRLYYFARGIDDREVETSRIRKALSVEETFIRDLSHEQCYAALDELIDKLNYRLAKVINREIKKLFVKIKFADFSCTTVEMVNKGVEISLFRGLLEIGLGRGKGKFVRLLGVGVKF